MQRQIPPLAQRMLEGLEQFVALDTPFYIDERLERLDIVRSSLSNPKITASEQVSILDHLKHPLIFLLKQIGILIPFFFAIFSIFLNLDSFLSPRFSVSRWMMPCQVSYGSVA